MSKTHPQAGKSKQHVRSPYLAGDVDAISNAVKELKDLTHVNRLDGGEGALHYSCMGANEAGTKYLIENTPVDLTLRDKQVTQHHTQHEDATHAHRHTVPFVFPM